MLFRSPKFKQHKSVGVLIVCHLFCRHCRHLRSDVCHASTISLAYFLWQLNHTHKSWPILLIVWPLIQDGLDVIESPRLATSTSNATEPLLLLLCFVCVSLCLSVSVYLSVCLCVCVVVRMVWTWLKGQGRPQRQAVRQSYALITIADTRPTSVSICLSTSYCYC